MTKLFVFTAVDFLISKRKIVSAELRSVMHQLENTRKEQESEAEQLAFFQSESMIDIFDRRIAAVPIDAVAIDKEIKHLEKMLKSVRQEISRKTKSDTGVIMSLYENMVKYATELGVGNSESIVNSFDWKAHHRETNNLLGIFWDFLNEVPTIVACFYRNDLVIDDWGRIVQPTDGGGRTTSVSIMAKTGIKKMCDGWIAVIDRPEYIDAFSRSKWIGYSVK